MNEKTRTLFSVVEVTDKDGARHCEVNWHVDLYGPLDEISLNAELTDKIIDMAEDLLEAEEELRRESLPVYAMEEKKG